MGGTDLELAKEIRGRGGRLPGHHRRRRDHGRGDRARSTDRRRRPGRHGALHRPAGPRRRIMAPLSPTGRTGSMPTVVVDERGVCLGLVYSSRIDPRGRAAADRASTSRARAACGSRARPAAPPRSCCASTSTATATARASWSASSRRASATSTPAPAGARTPASARSPARWRSAASAAPEGSYTAKLFADPALLGAKLREEADELAEAAGARRGDLGGRRRALLHARPLARRGHRSRRGRARSRPAGAEGHPAGVSRTSRHPPSGRAAAIARAIAGPDLRPAQRGSAGKPWPGRALATPRFDRSAGTNAVRGRATNRSAGRAPELPAPDRVILAGRPARAARRTCSRG